MRLRLTAALALLCACAAPPDAPDAPDAPTSDRVDSATNDRVSEPDVAPPPPDAPLDAAGGDEPPDDRAALPDDGVGDGGDDGAALDVLSAVDAAPEAGPDASPDGGDTLDDGALDAPDALNAVPSDALDAVLSDAAVGDDGALVEDRALDTYAPDADAASDASDVVDAPEQRVDAAADAAPSDGAAEATVDAPPDAAGWCVVGTVRPCYRGPAGTQGVGSCAAGEERCGAAGWDGACEGERLPAAERCDGVDNDCDGATDEGLAPLTCGVGACVRTIPSCVDGRPNPERCVPLSPGAEACNGVDDDCDYAVDEGLPAIVCGVGACQRSVSCARGAYPPCVPGAPAVERCDAVDNDCDGMTNEGLPVDARCFSPALNAIVGAGTCTYGTMSCNSFGWTCLTDLRASPSSEVCNGADDNCNGVTDEGYESSCAATVGACVRPGVQRCRADGSRYCDAPAGAPSPEVCNGVDDDCDGAVDEGGAALAGAPCAAGLGPCRREGVFRCATGRAVCDAVAGARAAEACDGVDNDCNGYVDDDLPRVGATCVVEHPWCMRHGNLMCVRGVGPSCETQAGRHPDDFYELAEVCNGRDDDCNGLVDEIPERQPDGTWRPCPRVP